MLEISVEANEYSLRTSSGYLKFSFKALHLNVEQFLTLPRVNPPLKVYIKSLLRSHLFLELTRREKV